MGGSNSGRVGRRTSIGATQPYTLTTRQLRLAGMFAKPRSAGRITFGSSWDEVEVLVRVDLDAAQMELTHETRSTRVPGLVTYTVPLRWFEPNFGGKAWGFHCPVTHRRARKLYLPYGGSKFAHIAAFRAHYPSQSLSKRDRRIRAATKIARQVQPGWDHQHEFPDKPPGMWLRTYDRMGERWDALQADAEALGIPALERLLGRMGITA